ncbi:hypothetical protein IJU97_03375 [bacterium]|nr:hypothetical protein [bacterium]
MKNVKLFILFLATIIAVALAVYVVRSTNKINKMMDEELTPTQTTNQENNVEPDTNVETVDALQESFDELFAQENIEDLYEGETDYGFIATPTQEDE